jgi:hypothetical protein
VESPNLRIDVRPLQSPAFFACAVPIYDPTFRQIVGRNLDIYPIAGKYPDSVPPQAPSNVGEDGMTVF